MGNAAQGQGEGGARPWAPVAPGAEGARSGATWEVQLATTEIARFVGVPAYHTSVIVGGREFYFDSQGIESGPALVSHLAGRPQGLKMEVRKVGSTARSGAALLQALAPFFAKGSYDVLHKNCNAFSDVALWFLLGTRLEGQYSRAERILLAAEPLSTHLLNQVLRAAEEIATERGDAAAAGVCQGGYAFNPLAEGFSAERVFAALHQSGCSRGGPAYAPSQPRCCGGGHCQKMELSFHDQRADTKPKVAQRSAAQPEGYGDAWAGTADSDDHAFS